MTEEQVKPIRRKIRRRREAGDETDPEKIKARKARMYFNEITQAAIVAYQLSSDYKERDRLYTTDILPAFTKLVENLINIHKFNTANDSPDELKSDCINFLFETIGKWDPNRGTPAFSYFNVVAKHCLIIKTKQKAQRLRRNVSINDSDSMSLDDQRLLENQQTIMSQEDTLIENETIKCHMLPLLHEIRSQVKTDNELATINSIITIFENAEHLDMLGKPAIFVYIRELSGLSQKQLATALQSIRKLYQLEKLELEFDLF